MVKELENHLENVDVTINISKVNGEIVISVLPRPKTSDSSTKNLIPFIVKGTDAEEVENALSNSLINSIPKISETTNNMNQYLRSIEKMEEESKMKEAEKKRLEEEKKKISESLEKFNDFIKKDEIEEAGKIYNSLFKKFPENQLVKNAKIKLIEAKSKSGEDLFSVAESGSFTKVSPMTEEQIELIKEQRTNQKIFI